MMVGIVKKHLAYIVLVVSAASCAYDSEEEVFGAPDCDPQTTTFSGVIEPIIAAKCALPGCHNGTNNSVPNWTVFSNVQANASNIKTRTSNRTMPPSSANVSLTAAEIEAIACWVDSGAQNN